jgi:hypothetical protein
VGKIVVNEPHLNENIPSGASKTISWSKQGTLGNVKLYYFHDGAYDYINTVDSNAFSSYAWDPVPTHIQNSSSVKVIQESTEETANEINGISSNLKIISQFSLTTKTATLI